ncbi:MAG: hypothetical protein DRJ56_06035 [Thermoprotei archaeon]|nr:MAG: hypothetical protein DRJ56_06035 [Thermoprotei archaeon]
MIIRGRCPRCGKPFPQDSLLLGYSKDWTSVYVKCPGCGTISKLSLVFEKERSETRTEQIGVEQLVEA